MNIKRRILSAFAVGLLVTLALGVTPVAAHRMDCTDIGQNSQFSGIHEGTTSARTGTKATISVPIYLGDCYGIDLIGGALSWISLEPDNPSSSTIVQVGVAYCHYTSGLCGSYPNQLRFFWAEGGCNNQTPQLHDLGPASFASHDFKIYLSLGEVYFLIDNAVVKELNRAKDTAINCWIGGDLKGEVTNERWDRGDSFGYYCGCSNDTVFTAMYYQVTVGGTWAHLYPTYCTWNDGGASGSYNQTYCSATGNGVMHVGD